MRLSAVVALLLSIGAFVLTILILFSGRNPGFLPDVYITKIDTSEIGTGAINLIPDRFGSLVDRLGDRAEEIVNGVVQTAARELGVHDVYVAHIMNYCVGDETPNQARDNKSADVNWCSKQRAGWHFNLTDSLERDIMQSNGTIVSLLDIDWPTAKVNDVNNAVKTVGKALFVFQVGAVAGTGLAMVLSLLGILASGRLFAFAATLVSLIAFIWVGVGSALGTVVSVKLRDGFRDNLNEYGISASISHKYLGMTWAATGAMLLVAVYWMFATCFGSRDHRREKSHRHSNSSTQPVVHEKRPRKKFILFGPRRY